MRPELISNLSFKFFCDLIFCDIFLFAVRAGNYDKSSNYYQVPRKITHLEEERTWPPLPSLSGRLNLGSRLKTGRQYPEVGRVATVRSKRLSDWFPSGETGPKLYGRFGPRSPSMKL